MKNQIIAEFEKIVEFSYNVKQKTLVVRFLSGESYALKVLDLPKKMLSKKPDWENCKLSPNKDCLIYKAGKETRKVLPYLVHAKGKLL